uniref:SFRICE_029637 n=1 Tax=Spodoptera frugiperda TaxID=7108 RepID=A0A2H1V857_SPOFR
MPQLIDRSHLKPPSTCFNGPPLYKRDLHTSIARIFPNKKRSLAESASTSTKLCVPMNMISRSQTYLQQPSITHFWWKGTLNLPNIQQ